MKRALLVALVGSAILAAPASAAEVEVRVVEARHHYASSPRPEWRAVFVAAPGERNDVRVSAPFAGPIRFHDPAAPVRAGDGCRLLDEHTAECSLSDEQKAQGPRRPNLDPHLSIAQVDAGDGDDVVRVTSEAPTPLLVADGGGGDDVLEGGATADELDGGGGGRDQLFGRGNYDLLTDGDVTGAADSDVLDGGAGNEDDVLSYEGRAGDLRIDLADRRGDGERGENDRIRGIANVTGGDGDDDIGGGPENSRLRGGPGDDHLDGEGGSDDLAGGSGDDRLHGHSGNDFLDGGPGRDQLRGNSYRDTFLEPTRLDRLPCGQGEDILQNPHDVFVRAECERMELTFRDGSGRPRYSLRFDPRPVRSASGGSVRLALGCTGHVGDVDADCVGARGTLSLSSTTGVPLGRAAVTTGPDQEPGTGSGRVVVRLNAAGRQVVSRGGVLKVWLRGKRLPDLRWRVRAR